jgi:hypothetical protein
MADPHNYFPNACECGTIEKGVWLGGKVDAVMYDSMPSEGMVLEIIEREEDFSPRSIRKEDRRLTYFQSRNDYQENTKEGMYLFCLFFLDDQGKTCWHLRPLDEWKGHSQYAEYFAKLKTQKKGAIITVPRAKGAARPDAAPASQPKTKASTSSSSPKTKGISNASC